MICERFQRKFSKSTVREILRDRGFSKRKSGSFPAKADPVKQRAFFQDVMLPQMDAALKGELALYFLDASHFVHGCDFFGSIWCRARRKEKTYSGRKRYNVLGAIDYVTRAVHTVTHTTYITATQIGEMLKILADDARKRGLDKVCVCLDNASYQKCHYVWDEVEKLRQTHNVEIELAYLTSYSPNLNLIKRLWKLIKAELRSQYYADFDSFKQRIDTIIADLPAVYKEQTKNLMRKPHIEDNLKQISDTTYEELPKTKSAA